MTTPIMVKEAKIALGLYLDDAGIKEPMDRYNALNRQIARTWLDMLQRVGLAARLDVFDVMAGKDELLCELIWQIPTGSGKSHVGVLSIERPTPALLEVQP